MILVFTLMQSFTILKSENNDTLHERMKRIIMRLFCFCSAKGKVQSFMEDMVSMTLSNTAPASPDRHNDREKGMERQCEGKTDRR